MANIGSGPGVGTGPKLEVNTVRPVGTTSAGAQNGAVQPPVGQSVAPQANPVAPQAAQQAATQVSTTALNPGKMPVDNDRVSTIKKAIESGSYPVVPAKISDAIIAAGLLLRVRA